MIFLIGFMGAGKTTVGLELSKKLGWSCFDMDRMIEEQYGMPVREIFRKFGESEFRKIETKILLELKGDQCIITTGGGVPGKEVNRSLMKQKGTVIWLNCSFDEIAKRIVGDETRPLLEGKALEEVKDLYTKRLALYKAAADYEIETLGLSVSGTVKKVLSCLKTDRHGETNE
ncbi:shikimate kinase [Bacillus sp. AK031]